MSDDRRWILVGAALIAGVGGCGAPEVDVGRASRPVSVSADRCGTWKMIELSAATAAGHSSASDVHAFCETITVVVPTALDVLGDPQGASATLTFRRFDTPGTSGDVTCKYDPVKNGSAPALVLSSCNRGVRAGQPIVGQRFELHLDAKHSAAPLTARVRIGDGAVPPPDAYLDLLGTTPNLAGVTLRVPASAVGPFSGVGLEDGPAFERHAFVAGGPTGLLVAGPSVVVTGQEPFGPGVQLTVPFDASFVGELPPGSRGTLAVQKVSEVRGPLEAIESSPVANAVVDDATSTMAVGLAGAGSYLTTVRDLTPIKYYGGPLLDQGLNVYLIWAGDFDAQPAEDPRPAVREFIGDLGSSSWYDILAGYGIANRSVTLAGEFERKDLTGFALRDDGRLAVYENAVKPVIAGGQDSNGLYLVLGAPGVAEATQFGSYCDSYCGYHSFNAVKFGFVGHPKTCAATGICGGVPSPSPHGTNIDGMISTIAHEIVEAVTDPEFNGWHGITELGYSESVENADKCTWRFTSVQGKGTAASPYYNLENNGRRYMVQSNWVNADDGYCAMGVESVAVEATPLFAGGLAINEVGTFSVRVTNTGPVYLDAKRLSITGRADGPLAGDPVPVQVPAAIPVGGSVDVTVAVQAPFEIEGNMQSVPFRFKVRDPNNGHVFGAEGVTNVDVRRADLLIDQAECMSLTMPAEVDELTWFSSMAQFHNAGTTVWRAGEYRLVALPLDVNMPNVALPIKLASDALPG